MSRIRAYFFILLFCHARSYSQTDGYNVFDIFVSNVISENQINHIVRDFNGFYWLQTSSGRIIRWDGIKFEIQDSIIGRKQSMNESYHYLYNPSQRILFMGNAGQVLYVDSLSHLKVLQDYKKEPKAPNLHHESYAPINESWEVIRKNNPKNTFDRFYQSYYFDKKTFRHITEPTGFYQFDSKGIQYYNSGKISDVASLSKEPPLILAVDSAVIVFSNHSYDIYKNGKKTGNGFHSFNLVGDRFQKTGVWFTQRGGAVSFFVLKNSIYKVELKNNKAIFSLVFVLQNKELYKRFYVDQLSGRVFLLPENGGLIMFEKKQYTLQKTGKSAAENIVYTLNKGYNNLTTNQFFQSRILSRHNRIFEYKNVSPVIYCENKYFYFINDSAYVFSSNGNLLSKKRIGKGYVSSAVDADTAIYIQNDALQRFSVKNFTNTKIPISFSQPALDNKIKWVAQSTEPNTLFIISGSTVFSLNTITNNTNKIVTLPSEHLRGLEYDKENDILFVGSSGQGAFCIIPKKKGYIKLPLDAKKSLLFCHYILKDHDGDFWLSTNSGLLYIEKKDFVNFINGKNNEISYGYLASGSYAPGIEYNGGFTNSGMIEGDTLYVSSMSGIVKLNIHNIKMNFSRQPFTPILDAIQLSDSLIFDKHVSLPPDYKTLQLNFSFPYIQNPGSYLEYRIHGGNDSSWITFQGNNLLLNNLQPGNYKVEVRSNGSGPSRILQIPLLIRAHWYNTWKGFLFFIAFLTLLLYVFFQTRIQIIKNNSLKEINKNHEKLFQIIAHDLRSPINHYQGLTEILNSLIAKKQYERLNVVGNEIENTGRKFAVLINNLMTWSLIEQKKMKVINESISISSVTNDILPMYIAIAESKGISFLSDIDQKAMVSADKSILSLLIRNIVDNAIKHSPVNSEVLLTAQRQNNKVVIACKNKYHPEKRKYLLWLFSQMQDRKSLQAQNSVGFGLRFITEFSGMIKGNIEMNLDEEFATWQIIIPSYP